MRLKRSSTKSKKSVKIIIVLMLVGMSIVGVGYLKNNFLTIKEINCRIGDQSCPISINQSLERQFLGKNYFLINDKIVGDYIKQNIAIVEKWEFNKKLIGLQMNLAISLRKPLAVIKDDKIYLIDRDAVIIGQVPTTEGFPELLINFKDLNSQIGEKFTQSEIRKSLELIEQLNDREFKTLSVKIENFYKIEVILNSGEKILFSGEKDLYRQLDSLQVIFTRSKIEGNHINQVDVRFDKPVID